MSVRAVDLVDRFVTGVSCPPGKLERDRARRRPDLQNTAARHPLERGREQNLQAAAELEVLGVDPVEYRLPIVGHGSSDCSRIAASSDA